MASAIISQAVGDYRAMESKGWIVNGKVVLPRVQDMNRKARNKKAAGIPARKAVCDELMEFFSPGGSMEWLIDVANIKISPSQIRLKLGIA